MPRGQAARQPDREARCLAVMQPRDEIMRMMSSSVPIRRRTRSQWDEFYRNYYNEVKKGKNQENSGGNKRVNDVVHSEARDVKRTKTVVHQFADQENESKRMDEENNNNAASRALVLRGKQELDVEAESDDGHGVSNSDDDEVEEEVVSNGSSLKIGPESGSGSGSKVGNLDEVFSSINKKVEETRVEADDDGRQVGLWSGGRPVIKLLDDEHLHDDVSVDLEKFTDSGNSTKSVDVSDNSAADSSANSVDSSESDSTSEEDDDFSDEDYKVDEPSTTDDDSDVSYSRNDVEPEKDDESDNDCSDSLVKGEEENSFNTIDDKKPLDTPIKSKRMNGKNESDNKQGKDDESDEGYNGDDDCGSRMEKCTIEGENEDVLIIIDDKEKFRSIGKRTRISGKEESDTEDHEIDDCYHAPEDCSGHNKLRVNKRKEDSVVIMVDDEQKLPRVRNSAKIDRKRDGELAGLNTNYQPSSNYGCMDNAKKDGYHRDTFSAGNVRKEVDDGINKSGLKKRKVLGLEILVDCDKGTDKENRSIANRLRSRTMKEQELGKFSSPASIPKSGEPALDMDDESKSSGDEEKCHVECVLKKGEQCSKKDMKPKRTHAARNIDLIKILVESINSLTEEKSPIEENDLTHETLPLKFKFEDEVQPSPEKSEWEKEMDSLFLDLELGLRESESDYDSSCVTEKEETIATEIDKSPAACCSRGEHESILDEQIGVVCKYCMAVILDIKYVLPPFYIPPPRRRDWKEYDESPSSVINPIHFQDSACGAPDSTTHVKGTVWDLIPGVEKEMYPHQREGFEFIWKNIAGDISLENLKGPLSDGGRGCIISHAPGTGKTRLTIVFLMTFLKLYPNCRPVIIAPRGMLLTWEAEFIKWQAHVPFHILNKKELSCNENAIAANIIGQFGCGGMDTEYIRLVKLYSWMKGRSVLGISYHLFEKLAGENGNKGQNDQIKKLLLELPGLLVLDEGHTPRNDQSLLWRALAKVATHRRIILSGTPFQNNMNELFNTLCLVNPKFINQIGSHKITSWCETRGRKTSMARKKWMIMTSSIGKNRDNGLMKLKAMLDPFVHVHKGTILQERLFGLRDTLVFLHPTELQKTLLETASKAKNIFHRIRLVSLVSVHPSLMPEKRRFSGDKSTLEEIKSDIDAGVKTKFVMKLIWLAGALGERVLVFSQYIDPLIFIKNQIMSHFSWNEGREVLYMDGNLDVKQRQDSISSFNDESSEAKVLFASERACSEGISLVGASRVVLLDTVWNPSVEKQAISRAYRLGQKRVVYVYRLFTSGTEVRQYAQQFKKEQISELIFSPVDGHKCEGEKSNVVSEDKVLEAMVSIEGYSECFEKIIHQPKESDMIEIFGWG
ncbi:hypothetical protein BUALT_Bualt01G0152300 [Buddleja alternifolia]|uniref:Uncharacterized protein n=1 Tax=Buddleja alternifolia TaxID=168488 RepID=A0AAV6YDT4_9LAMI|nr:hypothetical protein BUALT_Bualt01G0152300 [Buddleja alternifolia]